MLAVVHASFAQGFFVIIVSLALLTSKGWREQLSSLPADVAEGVRRLTLWTTGLIYLQIVLGAILRHTGGRLALHLVMAGAVAVMVFVTVERIRTKVSSEPRLLRSAFALQMLLIFQLMVGLGAYLGKLTAPEPTQAPLVVVAITTLHVATGSLMLAASLVLTLWVFHLLVDAEVVVQQAAGVGMEEPDREMV